MRRIILLLTVALILVVVIAASASPASAGLRKGQTNTNPGFSNNSQGDNQNNSTGCCNRGNSYAFGDFRN